MIQEQHDEIGSGTLIDDVDNRGNERPLLRKSTTLRTRQFIEFEESHHSESKIPSSSSQQNETTNQTINNNSVTSDTGRIGLSKTIVVLSILLVGGIVSTITYLVLNSKTQSDISNAFDQFSCVLEDSLNANIGEVFRANRDLVRAIASDAAAMAGTYNSTFPNYIIQGFESYAYQARDQAGLDVIVFAPIVNAENYNSYLDFANTNRFWLDESKRIFDVLEPGLNRSLEPPTLPLPNTMFYFEDNTDDVQIKRYQGTVNATMDLAASLHFSPPVPNEDCPTYQNINFLSMPFVRELAKSSLLLDDVTFSAFNIFNRKLVALFLGLRYHELKHIKTEARKTTCPGNSKSLSNGASRRMKTQEAVYATEPHGMTAHPVYSNLNPNTREVIGFIFSLFSWDAFLYGLLPEGVDGMQVVFYNTCGRESTYSLCGPMSKYEGEGDVHQTSYPQFTRTVTFSRNYANPSLLKNATGNCEIKAHIYASDEFISEYDSKSPVIFTAVVAALFTFMLCVFLVYDASLNKRKRKFTRAANQSDKILSQLFPRNIHDRLLTEQSIENQFERRDSSNRFTVPFSGKSADPFDTTIDHSNIYLTPPIADLFLNTTVFYGDIVGFTSWSSRREPFQVFILLETLFHEFDKVALKRYIYKVETVGDCYVAACGIPNPRKDHAVEMSRFAMECMKRTKVITDQLAETLGPETTELTMRMGLHSGPVIAGVVRGQNFRFQLFGETVTTAANMEHCSRRNCIRISPDTAKLLSKAGKESWYETYEPELSETTEQEKSFWLKVEGSRAETLPLLFKGESSRLCTKSNYPMSTQDESFRKATGGTENLLNCANQLLFDSLKRIAASRSERVYGQSMQKIERELSSIFDTLQSETKEAGPIHEVKSVIAFPKWKCSLSEQPHGNVDERAKRELSEYVSTVASRYGMQNFHNFEHSIYGARAVSNLFSHLKEPKETEWTCIIYHPMIYFSCLFASIIHNFNHRGVSNLQLMTQNDPQVLRYSNRCLSEQRSFTLAWDLLMTPSFEGLRNAIYRDTSEKILFRQIVVNLVIATDIYDTELRTTRSKRWETAFSSETEETIDSWNQKTTLLIEYMIQISELAHTFEKWPIYLKWNKRLFQEYYRAFSDGRADNEASNEWYTSELKCFDEIAIPLAKKLKQSGAFDSYIDECLENVLRNRQEWERVGKQLVLEMVQTSREDNNN